MQGNPAIALVLPVYNGAQYLDECLQSIKRQTFERYELLIGDDGSTDGTAGILEGWTDDRWRFMHSEQRLGLFGNLNRLIKAARAPLIHILCQDDKLEPDCLGSEVEFFTAHPDVAMTFCKMRIIDETSAETSLGVVGDLPVVMPPEVSLQYFYYYGCLPANLSTVCLRSEVFEQVGLFNESLKVAGDFEMWVRICQEFQMGVIHRRLVHLREHTRQLSRAHRSYLAHVLESRGIRARLLPQLPEAIRPAAVRYTLMRQNVFDTHFAMRCLVAGRWEEFMLIARTMGARDLTAGLFFWLTSANNHLFQPKPTFTRDAKYL